MTPELLSAFGLASTIVGSIGLGIIVLVAIVSAVVAVLLTAGGQR